jgi:hypothetical protein
VVCGFGTLGVGSCGMLAMAMGQDVAKLVALILVAGCALGLAIVNCSLWYVYDTAHNSQGNNTDTLGTRAGAITTRDSTSTRSRVPTPSRLPAWRRQVWLVACLVAVALPLSAFSVNLAQPPGTDWSGTALLLALLVLIRKRLMPFGSDHTAGSRGERRPDAGRLGRCAPVSPSAPTTGASD